MRVRDGVEVRKKEKGRIFLAYLESSIRYFANEIQGDKMKSSELKCDNG